LRHAFLGFAALRNDCASSAKRNGWGKVLSHIRISATSEMATIAYLIDRTAYAGIINRE